MNHSKLLLFIPLVVIIVVIYYYDHIENSITTYKRELWDNKDKNTKIVLIWTSFYNEQYEYIPNSNNCTYKCNQTYDRSKLAESSLILFHARDIQAKEAPNTTVPKIFYSKEPPWLSYFRSGTLPEDYFNYTMTYSTKADVRLPYTPWWPENMNRTEEELDEIVAKKSKLALIFSSHDNVKSGRETMVRYLQGYMNITALGKTFTKDRCNDTCYRQETESHFFYLAFENQICDEYTTEKFGRFTHFVVPIVFKRSVVYKEFPDEYYIAMDDFDTTEEFVAFLKKVAGDKELYKNYLRWSQTPELRQMFDPTEASCGLCELAHLQPKKIGNYKKEHSSKECDSEFTPNWIKHNGKAAN